MFEVDLGLQVNVFFKRDLIGILFKKRVWSKQKYSLLATIQIYIFDLSRKQEMGTENISRCPFSKNISFETWTLYDTYKNRSDIEIL
jgi:outer membrane lipoprotein-sorting protein